MNGHEIVIEDIGFPLDYKIQNVKDLENILSLFDSFTVCQGSVSTAKCVDIKSTFGPQFVESLGKWYHSKCLKIINKNELLHR